MGSVKKITNFSKVISPYKREEKSDTIFSFLLSAVPHLLFFYRRITNMGTKYLHLISGSVQ